MIGIAPLSVRDVGGGFGAASRGKIVSPSRIGVVGATPASARVCIGIMLGGTLGPGWVTGGAGAGVGDGGVTGDGVRGGVVSGEGVPAGGATTGAGVGAGTVVIG